MLPIEPLLTRSVTASELVANTGVVRHHLFNISRCDPDSFEPAQIVTKTGPIPASLCISRPCLGSVGRGQVATPDFGKPSP